MSECVSHKEDQGLKVSNTKAMHIYILSMAYSPRKTIKLRLLTPFEGAIINPWSLWEKAEQTFSVCYCQAFGKDLPNYSQLSYLKFYTFFCGSSEVGINMTGNFRLNDILFVQQTCGRKF